jgi:G3E family GTPase
LVLTKTDLATAEVITDLRQRLQRINPGARLYDKQQDNLDAQQLFDSGAYHETQLDVANWLQVGNYRESLPAPPRAAGKTANQYNAPPHDSYIQTFCIEREQPLSWTVLENWFNQLRRLRGKDLLRVKGIAYTVETELPVLVQGVQHVFQAPTTLAQWPFPTPRTQLVFITRNIPQQVVEENLSALEDSQSPQDMCAAAMILL